MFSPLDGRERPAEIGSVRLRTRQERVARALKEIQDVLAESPAAELGALYSALQAAAAAVNGKFMEILASGPHYEDDKLLTAQEVASVLGVTLGWVRRHTHELPTVRPSPGLVRYPRAALMAWKEGK